MGPKVARVPTVGISRFPLGNPEQKAIWMWPPWRGAMYTLRGKVVASPKSGPWWVLWIQVCPWLVLAPKVLQLCINHLVLVLCMFVWIVEACQFFLIIFWNFSTPLYLCKVLRVRECALTPYSSIVFNLGFTFESLKELGMLQFIGWY
jgi:hypothetical protein